ncbi:diguanylate cyclase domain-containing protein [Chitinimonas sp. BJB300]|uniref:diguanylate cyclase domain-containing protein n=1 Tax=Chitinimonas sp. BJB300 TaxID=1559339 RepID=UPI0013041EDD|nr:diguanylate cyclase [Chitinimonas sp. BJB300]
MNELRAFGLESAQILIVDDAPLNHRLLSHVLSDLGKIMSAKDGLEGLEMARQALPHLILLDVEMPGVDGYEVCRQLKANRETAAIPVIFVTAHRDAEHEIAALEAGAVDFIGKPFVPPVVRARVITQLTLKRQSDILHQMAIYDALTDVFGRRYFDMRLNEEWARHERSKQCLGLLLIDVDHFKQYYDHHGHFSGDACLQQIASAFKQCCTGACREVARFGSEEFAILVLDTSQDQLVQLAETLRAAVQQLTIPHGAESSTEVITISIGGCAMVPDGADPVDIVCASDTALAQARQAGRNRAVIVPAAHSITQ